MVKGARSERKEREVRGKVKGEREGEREGKAAPKSLAKRAASKTVAKRAASKSVAKRAASKTVANRAAAKPRPRKAFDAKLKTVKTDASVGTFLAGIPDAGQRADALVLEGIFGKATKQAPKMWGGAIVGYGDYSYVGRSGRAGDWFLAGFSPRKGTLTLYMLGGWAHDPALLAALGRHKLGGGCLYIKRLADVDLKALKTLVASALARAKAIAPTMMNQGAT